MIRFSHTVFALPFALLAAVMAWTAPVDPRTPFEVRQLLGVFLAMVGARSAAMAFNRIVDRKIDLRNPRTASRHLPSGKLSLRSVSGFFAVAVVLYLGGAACFWPNWLPLGLAIPVLLILLGYSYAKRFTALSHFWLGLALGLAPICAWVAIRGAAVIANPLDAVPALVLGVAVAFWVAGFDIIYACQDFEFDRSIGLKSMPAKVGVKNALRLAAVCHTITVAMLALLAVSYLLAGPELGLDWLYAVSVAAIAGLLVYEHRLVSADDLSNVNRAFFEVNAVISIGLFVVGLVDLTVL